MARSILLPELARRSSRRGDLLVLSVWGAGMMAVAWGYGPWMRHMVPGYWPLQGAGLLCWLVYRLRVARRGAPGREAEVTAPELRRAA